jgi:hypothetical protein
MNGPRQHLPAGTISGLDETYRRDYFLITFAPSSDKGFYEFKSNVYEFDLPAGLDLICEPVDYAACRFEADQVEAHLLFSDLGSLQQFARTEYLRDKKNNYFTLVLTHEADPQLARRILGFLNQPEVSEIPFSPGVVHVLYETASRDTTRRILLNAGELTNVLGCFGRELPDLTFEALRPTWEELSAAPLSMRRWWPILTGVLSAVEAVPAYARQAVVNAINAAQSQWQQVGGSGLSALSALARASGIYPTGLVLQQSLLSGNVDQMLMAYRASSLQFRSAVERERGAYPRELHDLAKSAEETVPHWVGEWDWPFPWRTEGFQAESVLEQALFVWSSYRGVTFPGELPNGIPFVLEFADRPESVIKDLSDARDGVSARSICGSRVAFWVSFLLDPRRALGRLKTSRSARYSSGHDVSRMVAACYRLWGEPDSNPSSELVEPAAIWSVCFPDLVNFAALPFDTHDQGALIRWTPAEIRELVGSIVEQTTGRDVRQSLGLPDPMAQLLNNLLCFSLHQGGVEAIETISRTTRAVENLGGFTGLVRLVV